MNIHNNTIFITGGTDGIGLCIANKLSVSGNVNTT